MTETLPALAELQIELVPLARKSAAQNWAANLRALQVSQPALFESLGPAGLPGTAPPVERAEDAADLEWVYARDGSLTVIESANRWWGGCSLPTRAARFMLRKADLPGTVICFLHPVHPAQLRVALGQMHRGQALLALVPNWRTARILLACEDFAEEIAAHRLYFAAGGQWEQELDRLLEEMPGLPTPSQFIRPIQADPAPADALVAPAQTLFANHVARRSQRVRVLRENWAPRGLRRVCVTTPSQFRLWDDIGDAMARALDDAGTAGLAVSRFDSDDPASASRAALAMAAAKCDGIVTPNTSRADLPALIPDDMPWVTWLTAPRIPLAILAGEHDALLVADPQWKQLAVSQGWSPDRVFAAGWPDLRTATPENLPPGVFSALEPCLAILSDTRKLDPPARVVEYSSHRLLWEAICHELLHNPFALGKSPDDYLSAWLRKSRLEEEAFDRALFLDNVVFHAWQQGIARSLLRSGIPVKLFGNGWNELDDLSTRAAAHNHRQQFHDAIRSVTALIHVRPTLQAHPIESAGKPVVRAHQSRDQFFREARLALSGRLAVRERSAPPLTAGTILRALAWR